MNKATKIGDTLFLSETHLLVLTQPIFRHERDAAYWAIRVRVQDGPHKGQELWMIGDTSSGPWGTPGAGFI